MDTYDPGNVEKVSENLRSEELKARALSAGRLKINNSRSATRTKPQAGNHAFKRSSTPAPNPSPKSSTSSCSSHTASLHTIKKAPRNLVIGTLFPALHIDGQTPVPIRLKKLIGDISPGTKWTHLALDCLLTFCPNHNDFYSSLQMGELGAFAKCMPIHFIAAQYCTSTELRYPTNIDWMWVGLMSEMVLAESTTQQELIGELCEEQKTSLSQTVIRGKNPHQKLMLDELQIPPNLEGREFQKWAQSFVENRLEKYLHFLGVDQDSVRLISHVLKRIVCRFISSNEGLMTTKVTHLESESSSLKSLLERAIDCMNQNHSKFQAGIEEMKKQSIKLTLDIRSIPDDIGDHMDTIVRKMIQLLAEAGKKNRSKAVQGGYESLEEDLGKGHWTGANALILKTGYLLARSTGHSALAASIKIASGGTRS